MSDNKEENAKIICKDNLVRDPLLPDPLLGTAKMTYDDIEEPILKKNRIYVQKCMICKKGGQEICNRACNEHRDEVRSKQNLQRSNSYKKTKGLGVDRVPFKVRYNVEYNKVTSYFLDIMVPASRVQGEFIALTNVSNSVYALKNHGVAYC